MAIVGWTRADMLIRYTRGRASERAAAGACRLDLGKPLIGLPAPVSALSVDGPGADAIQISGMRQR